MEAAGKGSDLFSNDWRYRQHEHRAWVSSGLQPLPKWNAKPDTPSLYQRGHLPQADVADGRSAVVRLGSLLRTFLFSGLCLSDPGGSLFLEFEALARHSEVG